jgi:uncharacterized DUF497 family protein
VGGDADAGGGGLKPCGVPVARTGRVFGDGEKVDALPWVGYQSVDALTKYIHTPMLSSMDIRYDFNGTTFMWNAAKAAANVRKHHVSFEQAAQVFFDPLFQLVEAGRNDEARDAVLGFDAAGRVLFVVHIISARKATAQERLTHDF